MNTEKSREAKEFNINFKNLMEAITKNLEEATKVTAEAIGAIRVILTILNTLEAMDKAKEKAEGGQ